MSAYAVMGFLCFLSMIMSSEGFFSFSSASDTVHTADASTFSSEDSPLGVGFLAAPDGLLSQGQISKELARADSCWHRPLVHSLIQRYCGRLDDEGRSRITIAITNCHLDGAGLDSYPCAMETPIKSCRTAIASNTQAFNSYTTFYSQVDTMCFFMQKDLFQAATESAVSSLISAASGTAVRLQSLHKDAAKILTSVQDGHRLFSQHILDLSAEETKRFNTLSSAVSGVSSGVTDIKSQQDLLKSGLEEAISTQETIRATTAQIHQRQTEAVAAVNRLDEELMQLQASQSASFATAHSSLSDLRNRTAASFIKVLQQQEDVVLSLSNAAQRLAVLTANTDAMKSAQERLLGEAQGVTAALHKAREEVLDVLLESLAHVKALRLEALSASAMFFYPMYFFACLLLTTFARSANARVPLLLLGGVSLALEQYALKSMMTASSSSTTASTSTSSSWFFSSISSCASMLASTLLHFTRNHSSRIGGGVGSEYIMDDVETSHHLCWLCRRVTSFLGLLILIRSIANYRDPVALLQQDTQRILRYLEEHVPYVYTHSATTNAVSGGANVATAVSNPTATVITTTPTPSDAAGVAKKVVNYHPDHANLSLKDGCGDLASTTTTIMVPSYFDANRSDVDDDSDTSDYDVNNRGTNLKKSLSNGGRRGIARRLPGTRFSASRHPTTAAVIEASAAGVTTGGAKSTSSTTKPAKPPVPNGWGEAVKRFMSSPTADADDQDARACTTLDEASSSCPSEDEASRHSRTRAKARALSTQTQTPTASSPSYSSTTAITTASKTLSSSPSLSPSSTIAAAGASSTGSSQEESLRSSSRRNQRR